MKFIERSFYSSKGLRPRPSFYFNESEQLVIAYTNWGQKVNQDDVFKTIEGYLLSSLVDDEVTSPFISVPHLGKTANHLRTALLLLNELLYKKYNSSELSVGLEIFVGFKKNDEFVFGHIGQPNILISRKKMNILPVYQNLDLSLDLSKENLLPPVPSKLIGINASVDLEIESLKPQDGDKLLLLSYSWIPKEILNLKDNQRSFENITKTISDISDQSFWLGMLEF